MQHESPTVRRARLGLPPFGRQMRHANEAPPTQDSLADGAGDQSQLQSAERPLELAPVVEQSRSVSSNSDAQASSSDLPGNNTPALPPAGARKQRLELNALEREFLPPLLEIQETPPSPLPRKLLWTIIGLVFVLIVWASIGEISIVATAPGKFIPAGRVKQVQPLESSVVKAIHVREGQRVEQGELLLELDTTLTQADLKANADKYTLNQLEQARLRAELTDAKPHYSELQAGKDEIAFAEQTRQARIQAHAAKLAQVEAEVVERTSALQAAEAILNKYQQTLQIAAEREAGARSLLDSGVIPKFEYLQLKQALIVNQNDLAAQENTLKQAEAALQGAQQRLAQVKRDRITDIYNDLTQRVATAPQLKSDLDKARQLDALKTIRAPVSGTIQRIEVTTLGQVVTPAQSLITIVPDGTPLIVEATLSNQDIGYAQVGQEVEIKVDTFPFQKYGALKGKLIWISPDAEDRSAASSDLDTRSGLPTSGSASAIGQGGYVYKVHIQPEQTGFMVNGKVASIQAGMTVQADITTDHRKVIEFFLSPVTKYLDEGLKVR